MAFSREDNAWQYSKMEAASSAMHHDKLFRDTNHLSASMKARLVGSR